MTYHASSITFLLGNDGGTPKRVKVVGISFRVFHSYGGGGRMTSSPPREGDIDDH